MKKDLSKKDILKRKKNILAPGLELLENKTVGDLLADVSDQWMENMIRSGELFKIDIYDLIRLMDDNNKASLFERLDQLSLIELAVDYKLDFTIVKKWIDRYIYCRIL